MKHFSQQLVIKASFREELRRELVDVPCLAQWLRVVGLSPDSIEVCDGQAVHSVIYIVRSSQQLVIRINFWKDLRHEPKWQVRYDADDSDSIEALAYKLPFSIAAICDVIIVIVLESRGWSPMGDMQIRELMVSNCP